MATLITACASLFVTLYGITAAMLTRNPYWYSYFTIGSYVFFGTANWKIHGETTIPLAKRSNRRCFLTLYAAYFGIGTIIDVVYGRVLGGMWHYPHFDLRSEILHVLIIGYPFAFLSVGGWPWPLG